MLRKFRTYINRKLNKWLLDDKEETWYYKIVRFLDKIDTKFYKFGGGIKQVIKWLPVVWRQRDWDHGFTYELLRAKIAFIKRHFEKETHIGYVGMERDIEYMSILIKLLDEIIEEDFGLSDYNYSGIDHEISKKIYKREKKVKRLFWKIMENKLEHFWI